MKSIGFSQGKMDKEVIESNAAKSQPQPQLKEIVRILNTDIKGDANIYYGLTLIKGISWTLSNVICYLLKIQKERKVGSLNDAERKKVEELIKNLDSQNLPAFILNRPRTADGRAKHLISSDLDLQIRMDVKRLREIQSYRGIRHALNLPVRGQRTKSHFRRGKSLGVVKKKLKQKVGTRKKG